ncbi:hypothetical protein KKI24_07955 [bacterium]|nr:hypothetical protein [bacterium]
MTVPTREKATARTLLGVFMVSFCALMFEVSLTRMLSIVLWYHFAFLIVSGALMGYGAAGSWRLLFPALKQPFFPVLLFAGCPVPLVFAATRLPFDPAMAAIQPLQWGYLVLMFLMLALPFFFCGLCINLILRQFPEDSFRIYSLDLLGAALGCIAFFGIAPRFSELQWIAVMSTMATGAALMFATARIHVALVVAAGSVLGLAWTWGLFPQLRMNPYKTLPQALQYPGSRTMQTQWNAVSRVDWFASPMARFAPGLSLDYRGLLPFQTGLTIDGDRVTAFSTPEDTETSFLRHLPIRVVLDLPPEPRTILVMNVLGGQDILATVSGKVHIDAQTDNRILGDWLNQHLSLPGVTVHAVKARALLARPPRLFDRIILSLEGALPTATSGMISLRTSPLETIEGMTSLLIHLESGGWLSIHRYLLPPPRAELRTMATLIEAMKRLGWRPEKHLGIFRTVSTIMMLVSQAEWDTGQKKMLRAVCAELGYTPVYYPGMPMAEANQTNRFEQPVYALAARELLQDDPTPFFERQVFDIRPVPDNRPFFYHFLKPARLLETLALFDHKWEALLEAGLLLPLLFAGVLLLAGILIVLPLLITSPRHPRQFRGMSYFFWIGLGFMAVEIVLIENMIVFLGEPVYSLAAVLAVLLISSGLGAGTGARVPERVRKQGLGVLIGVIILYAFLLERVLTPFAGSTMPVRLLMAAICIGIPGFLMGIPFPRGIRMLSQQQLHRQIDLAWSLNGFASVIAACGSMLVAHYIGFRAVLLLSALMYGLAFRAAGAAFPPERQDG